MIIGTKNLLIEKEVLDRGSVWTHRSVYVDLSVFSNNFEVKVEIIYFVFKNMPEILASLDFLSTSIAINLT